MEQESRARDWEVWGAALIVTVAVLVGIKYKGINGETLSEAVKDIGAAIIPILAAVVAARLVTKGMDPSERFLRVGEDALRCFQRKHPNLLTGPRASHDNYDPEKPGKAGRYLFFQKGAQAKKAQFVPVLPLREGVIEIRVPRTTLLQLGVEREALEQTQTEMLAAVRQAVIKELQTRWAGAFEILEHKHPDIAIILDVDEAMLGPRKYSKLIGNCLEAAYGAITGE